MYQKENHILKKYHMYIRTKVANNYSKLMMFVWGGGAYHALIIHGIESFVMIQLSFFSPFKNNTNISNQKLCTYTDKLHLAMIHSYLYIRFEDLGIYYSLYKGNMKVFSLYGSAYLLWKENRGLFFVKLWNCGFIGHW